MIAFLQARCSSTRFPKKVLARLGEVPLIIFQVNRILLSKFVEKVIVVTSKEQSDDELCSLLQSSNVPYFRGDLADVNLRFREALMTFRPADAYVMRLTADCPLICPEILDCGISSALTRPWDYFSNTVIRTFPDGLDFEIFNIDTFLSQPREQMTDYDKEHVTPFFYRNHDLFSIGQLVSSSDYSSLRMTVDYPEDLALITEMIGQPNYSPTNVDYSYILRLYNEVMCRRGLVLNFQFEHTFTVKGLGVSSEER